MATITDESNGNPAVTSDRQRIITATSRRLFPLPVWGNWRSKIIHQAYWQFVSSRATSRVFSWFGAEFPFASSPAYFLFYGTRGMVEYQVIIPRNAIASFLSEVERLLRRESPDAVMCSLKLFAGKSRYLNFAADGVCFTMDFAATSGGKRFLEFMDDLCLAHAGIPNISKDSRLPRRVVTSAYSEYELFRSALAAYDGKRHYQSELSQRLDL
jgi:decaprenylphospho-beta-D-ribofuranose 2-oxidase